MNPHPNVVEGEVFVVDNRRRDHIVKLILLIILIIVFPVSFRLV